MIRVPGKDNPGYSPATDYAAELELYARSLPATFGQDKVLFLHARPTAAPVPEVTAPKRENAAPVEFNQWPRSLQDLAAQLGAAAAGLDKTTNEPK